MSGDEISVEDLPWQRLPDRPLLARLYHPVGSGPYPAVIDIHGGAWALGDRMTDELICEKLAASGVLVASIDYRMPPEACYPESVADVHLGIRWLKDHAREFATEPHLVGGIGFSSGGHQLMLCAMRPSDLRYSALASSKEGADARLNCVVSCYSVLDPLARFQMALAQDKAHLAKAHRAYWPTEADMAEGNPQRMLERGEVETLPPALVIQGVNDDNLPRDTAARFAEAYRRRGGFALLKEYADAPHGFMTKDIDSPAASAAFGDIVDFIRLQVGAPSG